jgi:hypothetical protein
MVKINGLHGACEFYTHTPTPPTANRFRLRQTSFVSDR